MAFVITFVSESLYISIKRFSIDISTLKALTSPAVTKRISASISQTYLTFYSQSCNTHLSVIKFRFCSTFQVFKGITSLVPGHESRVWGGMDTTWIGRWGTGYLDVVLPLQLDAFSGLNFVIHKNTPRVHFSIKILPISIFPSILLWNFQTEGRWKGFPWTPADSPPGLYG